MEAQNQPVLLLGGYRRAPMNQDEFDTKFNYTKNSRCRRVSDTYQQECCVFCRLNFKSNPGLHPTTPPNPEQRLQQTWEFFSRYFPIMDWLRLYVIKQQIVGDISAGLAIGLHSIAQGLAFAFLAGLPPISGLYTTLFAAIIYTFLGTSPLSFLGCNVILSFLTRNVIERFSIPYDYIYLLHPNSTHIPSIDGYEQMRIAATLTFLAAIIQGVLYTMRLEFLFSYVSQQVLSGFSIGLATRIIFNQLQHILHVKGNSCLSEFMITMTPISAKVVPPSYKQCAFMAAYKSLYNKTLNKLPNFLHTTAQMPEEGCLTSVWECLDYINLYTMAISVCATLFLIFAKQILNPLFQIKAHSPIPFEFILIVFASLMSYLLDIHGKFHVEIIGHMNKSFTTTLPTLEFMDDLFIDSLAVALLMYVIHCRNATNALKERKLKINEQQELAALITIGSFSAFFGALPVGSSMSRNRLGLQAGATSLLVNVVVIVILVPTILWVTIFFIPLPMAILSCVVLSSLGETFMDVTKLPILWNTSKFDVITWAFTCSITLFSSNSSFALFISILFAAFTVIGRIQCPKFQYLVNVTGSGSYYAERDCYGSDLLDESGVAVVRFEAPLLYNNVAYFKRQVLAAAENIKGQLMTVGIGTRTGSMKSANAASIAGVTIKDVPMNSTLLISGDIVPNYEALNSEISWNKVIIIDFSSIPLVDAAGLDAMKHLFVDFSENKIKLLFASVNAEIRHHFKIFDGFEVVAKSNFFPSVHDAVLFSQHLGGMIAPSIHMSVSMNGCRDLITLSTATSNHELVRNQITKMEAPAEATPTSTTTVILHGRPSLPAMMMANESPPPSPNMLRATASSMSR